MHWLQRRELRKQMQSWRSARFRDGEISVAEIRRLKGAIQEGVFGQRHRLVGQMRTDVTDLLQDATHVLISAAATVKNSDALLEVARMVTDDNLERISRRRSALHVIDVFAAVLPARIAREDLGDYVEDINCRCAKGQGPLVWLRVLAAILWTSINSVGYALKALGKRQAG